MCVRLSKDITSLINESKTELTKVKTELLHCTVQSMLYQIQPEPNWLVPGDNSLLSWITVGLSTSCVDTLCQTVCRPAQFETFFVKHNQKLLILSQKCQKCLIFLQGVLETHSISAIRNLFNLEQKERTPSHQM